MHNGWCETQRYTKKALAAIVHHTKRARGRFRILSRHTGVGLDGTQSMLRSELKCRTQAHKRQRRGRRRLPLDSPRQGLHVCTAKKSRLAVPGPNASTHPGAAPGAVTAQGGHVAQLV